MGLEVDDDSGWHEVNLSSPVSHRTRYGTWNATGRIRIMYGKKRPIPRIRIRP